MVSPSVRSPAPALPRARPFSSVTAVTRSNHRYWKSESDRQCCQIPRPPCRFPSPTFCRSRETSVLKSRRIAMMQASFSSRSKRHDNLLQSPSPLALPLPLAAPLPLPSLEGETARASNRDEMVPFIPSRRRVGRPSSLRSSLISASAVVHLQFCTDGTSVRLVRTMARSTL